MSEEKQSTDPDGLKDSPDSRSAALRTPNVSDDPSSRAEHYAAFVRQPKPLTQEGVRSVLSFLSGDLHETRDDMRNWAGGISSIDDASGEDEARKEAIAQLNLIEEAAGAFTDRNPHAPNANQMGALSKMRSAYKEPGLDDEVNALVSVLKMREGTYSIAVGARELRERIEANPDKKVMIIIGEYLARNKLSNDQKTQAIESRKQRNDVAFAFFARLYPKVANDPRVAIAIDLQKNRNELAAAVASAIGGKTPRDCTIEMAMTYLRNNLSRYSLSEEDLRMIENKAKEDSYLVGVGVFRAAAQQLQNNVVTEFPE